MMRSFIYASLIGFTLLAYTYQEPDESNGCTVCAPTAKDGVDKNGHTYKSCHCDASNNKSCNKDGTRSTEGMANCVNGEHCKKGCCHCCPRD